MITSDDILPGAKFQARHQGTCITPQTVEITVQWVGVGAVYYSKPRDPHIYDTPVDRFLEIVNQ